MPQVGLASSCCCRRKAPQPSPLTLGSPVGTMAVPYPPTRGGDGALGCERWDLRSPQWGGGLQGDWMGGTRVLTWARPRGSCRMPRVSQAGSGIRSIVPGLGPAAQSAGTRCWQSSSAPLAHSCTPALTGIYSQRVPVCLLFFPLAEAEL